MWRCGSCECSNLARLRPIPCPCSILTWCYACSQLPQAEVLVCSRGSGGLLGARMALLSACWACGIKAELVPRASPTLTEQYEYAHTRGIRWLVILDEGRSDVVKVRHETGVHS